MFLILTALFQATLLFTDATKERNGATSGSDTYDEETPAALWPFDTFKRPTPDQMVTAKVDGGTVRGKYISLPNGQKIEAYLGIPYAEPPINKLRFQAPIPKQPWGDKTLDALKFGPLCLQDRQRQAWDLATDENGRRYLRRIILHRYEQSEDCLTLNIYTRRHQKLDENDTWSSENEGGIPSSSSTEDQDEEDLKREAARVRSNDSKGGRQRFERASVGGGEPISTTTASSFNPPERKKSGGDADEEAQERERERGDGEDDKEKRKKKRKPPPASIKEEVREAQEEEEEDEPLMPVMVYFHGGSYQMSGGRFYPGEWLTYMGGVVVVTLNYRLGPFGFLSTGDNVLPGNAGLMDQLLALEWVRNNIKAFGGHPGRITIFGNSAGGACVGLHMLSPLTNGMFTAAIAQSGSAVAKWAVQRHPKRQAQRLARDVGCEDSENSEAILQCLKNQSAENIARKAGIPNAMSIRFAPVIDRNFLPGDPETLVRKGKIHPVPFMTGLTKDEVSVWMSHYSNPSSVKLTKQKVKKYLQHLLSENCSSSEANLEAVVHAVYTEYTRKKIIIDQANSSGKPIGALILAEIISDVGLKAPGVQLAKLISKHSSLPVYMYEFVYWSPDDISIQNNSWVGSYHESELHYIFGLPFLDLKNSFRQAEDAEISRNMIRMWTDFAKFGNPTPDFGAVNFTWQQYSPGQHKYASIGSTMEMKKVYKERRMTFWNSFIPLFTEHPMAVTVKRTICSTQQLLCATIILAVMSATCLTIIVYMLCSRRKRKEVGLVIQGSPTSV